MVTRMQERNDTVGWTLMTPGHRFCLSENRVSRFRFYQGSDRFLHRLECKDSSNRLNLIIFRKPWFLLWKSVTKISRKRLSRINIVNLSTYFLFCTLGITNNGLLPLCLFLRTKVLFHWKIRMLHRVKRLLSFKG